MSDSTADLAARLARAAATNRTLRPLLADDLDDAVAALEVLAEWCCPGCGATTRARMADSAEESELAGAAAALLRALPGVPVGDSPLDVAWRRLRDALLGGASAEGARRATGGDRG